MLTLPIKKKWFDMIKSGEKKEEYREYKPYYKTRFNNILDKLDKGTIFYVIFKNGYGKNAPKIKCKIDLSLAETRSDIQVDWGAKPDTLYYILRRLSVEEV